MFQVDHRARLQTGGRTDERRGESGRSLDNRCVHHVLYMHMCMLYYMYMHDCVCCSIVVVLWCSRSIIARVRYNLRQLYAWCRRKDLHSLMDAAQQQQLHTVVNKDRLLSIALWKTRRTMAVRMHLAGELVDYLVDRAASRSFNSHCS